MRKVSALASCSLVTGLVSPALAAPVFMGLGDLPGGTFSSAAYAVSGDGKVVVGHGISDSGQEAFRWEAGTLSGLGDLAGGQFHSVAYGVNGDGSVVVGTSFSGTGQDPFRWEGSMLAIANDGDSVAWDVSAGGNTVVGTNFSWSSGTTADLTGLGAATAWGVSGNGQVIVGHANDQAYSLESGALTNLGSLGDGTLQSRAWGASLDGAIIVGWSDRPDGSVAAVLWDDGVISDLGGEPAEVFQAKAFDVSADGNTAVGTWTTSEGSTAFVWDVASGASELRPLLESLGLSLEGWNLEAARGLSDDGQTIVGWGWNPQGDQEAWIATIPEPSTTLLLAAGLVAMGVRGPMRATATGRLVRQLADRQDA